MSSDIHDELVALIGIESPLQKCVDEVTPTIIRHYVEPIQDENPLYTNEEYAKNSKYGSIIAPPYMMQTWSLFPMWGSEGQEVKWNREVRQPEATDPLEIVLEKLDKAGYPFALSADIQYEYVRPVKAGDQITSQEKLIAVSEEKKTSAGVGYFTTYLRTYWNQKGEVLCKHQYVNYKFKAKEA